MASGGGRVVSKIPIAVWSCAPGFSDASSRSPLPFPLVFFLLLFSHPPVRPTPAPSRADPPALRGLSPRFTRASANLFRRLGDGGRRNRSTLYSSRIDRQPRTDMEALYFPSSHLHVALSEALLSMKRALSWHRLSLFLSLPTVTIPQHPWVSPDMRVFELAHFYLQNIQRVIAICLCAIDVNSK